MFKIEYAPQNIFCYAIDKKADPLFKKRIHNLQKCFPKNVFISKTELDIRSDGRNVSLAHYSCLKAIHHKFYKYVFYLQNYDMKMKTNQDLIEILKRSHGANLVSADLSTEYSYLKNENYSLAELKIFKNGGYFFPVFDSTRWSFIVYCTICASFIVCVLQCVRPMT